MSARLHVNSTYGNWTVVSEPVKRGTHRYYLCVCKCGSSKQVREYVIKHALDTTSCQNCVGSHSPKTHGATNTFEFRVWTAMRRRCTYTRHSHYRLYGGRGISVCERWATSFVAFLADMGPCPFGAAGSLDRIDSNGNYEPPNCRWLRRSDQSKNRRTVRLYDGLTLPDLANKLGVKYTTLKRRIAAGWPPERLGLPPVAAGTRKGVHDAT